MASDARCRLEPSARPTVVFTGAFGAGKTEVAISYALAARARGLETRLVDLDVVTPYFRVGDYRDELEEQGITVIAPEGGLASFELPALPPEIAGALLDTSLHVVLDVGGDAPGARLLATYAAMIESRGYDHWVVANPFRPSTATPHALLEEVEEIARWSGLRPTGLVANPNLGPSTRLADVSAGLERVRQAADELGLPIAMLAVARDLLDHPGLPPLPVLPLQLTVRLPWQSSWLRDA